MHGGFRQPVPGHGDTLEPDEICIAGDWLASTPARTGDLGRRLRFVRAVETLDALCNATGITPHDIRHVTEKHSGTRGIVQLREVLSLVDAGAESPPETTTRLVLLDGRLPRPRTQVKVRDATGHVVARCHMGWPR
ncbi:hypothetical protein ACFYVR_12470 [Rhodococcus sp. NPDC003318]|uniref:hypothetical protein n=1 Tax=Rhodococcus sp. NPDC003318 TaxID=3364503 RepID=UPI0036C86A9C